VRNPYQLYSKTGEEFYVILQQRLETNPPNVTLDRF